MSGGASRAPGPPAPGEVRFAGDAAVVVGAASPAAAQRLAAAVRATPLGGVLEVVPAFRSVLVVLDPVTADAGGTAEALSALDLRALARGSVATAGDVAPARPPVVMPVIFDGPDVGEVCRLTGMTAHELEEALLSSSLRVAVVGFSPGFAYLEGLPPPLSRVPRRASPRTSVPAGSLALAGGRAAVYPQATPGGWQLVGRTLRPLFDPLRPPYAVLQVGDTVRLERRDPSDSDHWVSPVAPAGPPEVPGPPDTALPAAVVEVLEVEDPGARTLVQDAGRRGHAHLGVPVAGPADPVAHLLANRLVGNVDGAAALELLGRGPTLRCLRRCFVSVVGVAGAGNDPVVAIDGREAGAGCLLPLEPGQRLTVGAARTGLRSYLALAGGLGGPAVMGSRSSDTLSGLGPGPLEAGRRLSVAGPPGPMHGYLATGALSGEPWGQGSGRDPGAIGRRSREARGEAAVARRLRVVPGPDLGWFRDSAADLYGRDFLVDPASDRVGWRLRPAGAGPVRRVDGELESQGVANGMVQVPPDGNPVVLGPDHATLGGYPVAAVVITADLGVLGQCRPGDRVRFEAVGLAAAVAARAALRRALDRAVVGSYPVVPA